MFHYSLLAKMIFSLAYWMRNNSLYEQYVHIVYVVLWELLLNLWCFSKKILLQTLYIVSLVTVDKVEFLCKYEYCIMFILCTYSSCLFSCWMVQVPQIVELHSYSFSLCQKQRMCLTFRNWEEVVRQNTMGDTNQFIVHF